MLPDDNGTRKNSRSQLYGDHPPSIDTGLLACSHRSGSVLSKGTILKLEHYQSNDLLIDTPSNTTNLLMSPPSNSQGNEAPFWVFGAPNYRGINNMNVYGVAQPDLAGLQTISNLFPTKPFWCNTREEPIIYIAGRPFVLRDSNAPLKNWDAFPGISGARLEQLEERLQEDVIREAQAGNGMVVVHVERGGNVVVPSIVYCEPAMVKTSKQLFDDYIRIPISHGQSPFDSFIDELCGLFGGVDVKRPVVFTCGMGVGRSTSNVILIHTIATYAMILGCLIRRWQTMAGGVDPVTPASDDDPSKLTLRLVCVLEQALGQSMGQSAVQWALQRRNLLDNLRQALLGDYKPIVDLTRALKDGQNSKNIVDAVIDECSQCLNLREQILLYRLKGITPHDDGSFLDLALSYLERYFSLIVLNEFLQSVRSTKVSFGAWIRERAEVWNMFLQLRRHHNKLRAFRPIDDLSNMATSSTSNMMVVDPAVIKARQGTILGPHDILKLDHWGTSEEIIEGAPNFRRISNAFPVHVTAQPTLSGLERLTTHLHAKKIVWINVREEPIVYINGEPYVLRDQWNTLRNIKTYSGIAGDRVDFMEERLKEDILNESMLHNRILLHSEVSGSLIPLWESVESPDMVLTPKQLFAKNHIQYHRVPVTAEQPPEPADFDHIAGILEGAAVLEDTAIVFNCQMGLTRSTTCAVIAVQYLESTRADTTIPTPYPIADATLHYALVNAVLRGMRVGVQAKRLLDHIIDQAGDRVNLRLVIEEFRAIRNDGRRSIVALKRYCLLLLFGGYLRSIKHSTKQRTFTEWLADHPEFVKLLTDQEKKPSIDMLLVESAPIHDQDTRTMAALDDVVHVVHQRHGSVLAPMTILKYDHFPGCQRPSLPERIDGAPNFRQVTLDHQVSVYGVAMPTEAAIARVLDRINAPRCLWVCLREEPVVYVNGRPFVLRQVKDPVINLEMTGIPSRRVESMESRLREDVLIEARHANGKVLLHEEAEDGSGVMAVWEGLAAEPEGDAVQTMAQVYERWTEQCLYKRVAVTDEQSPIPAVFDELLSLITSALSDGINALVFNCQMGRGRTTTGMVIAAMLIHRYHEPIVKASSDHRLLLGHYRVIDKLVAVLEQGQRAKALADWCIDMCSQLQNLRECIFDQRQAGQERAINYLVRYFYLVAFAGFLLADSTSAGTAGRFQRWLEERREIGNLIADPHTLLE